jgi:hypothetical protein
MSKAGAFPRARVTSPAAREWLFRRYRFEHLMWTVDNAHGRDQLVRARQSSSQARERHWVLVLVVETIAT